MSAKPRQYKTTELAMIVYYAVDAEDAEDIALLVREVRHEDCAIVYNLLVTRPRMKLGPYNNVADAFADLDKVIDDPNATRRIQQAPPSMN